MLTQKKLKEILDYDVETGNFLHKRAGSNRIKKGSIAGCISYLNNDYAKKYNQISIDNKIYRAHNLAWLYVHGVFPSGEIDHINGNGLDNRITNLRDVTKQENQRNKRLSSSNKSGISGVCWSKKQEQWQSHISNEGKQKHLGFFDDFFEAICARKSAEYRLRYYINHGAIRPL